MTTYCGIKLTGEQEDPCTLVCINGDTVTLSTTEDEELMDALRDHRPKILALNAPETSGQQEGFRENEQELVDKGYQMRPLEMRNQQLLERAEFLSNTIKRSGMGIQIIESNPYVIAQQLDVEGDAVLEEHGIDTGPIENVAAFDAALLALTAKLYDEHDHETADIVLPHPETDDEDDTDTADEDTMPGDHDATA